MITANGKIAVIYKFPPKQSYRLVINSRDFTYCFSVGEYRIDTIFKSNRQAMDRSSGLTTCGRPQAGTPPCDNETVTAVSHSKRTPSSDRMELSTHHPKPLQISQEFNKQNEYENILIRYQLTICNRSWTFRNAVSTGITSNEMGTRCVLERFFQRTWQL